MAPAVLGQLGGLGEPHGGRQAEPEPVRAGSLRAFPFLNKKTTLLAIVQTGLEPRPFVEQLRRELKRLRI